MIRTHLDALDGGRLRVNETPRFAAVLAAPQSIGLRVNHVPIQRIEDEEFHDAPQIEHTPRLAAIVSYVSTDRKSTRLNSSHLVISYAVFCLKQKMTARAREVIQYALPGVG